MVQYYYYNYTYQYFHALRCSELWMYGRVEHVCIPQNHCPIPTVFMHHFKYTQYHTCNSCEPLIGGLATILLTHVPV